MEAAFTLAFAILMSKPNASCHSHPSSRHQVNLALAYAILMSKPSTSCHSEPFSTHWVPYYS